MTETQDAHLAVYMFRYQSFESLVLTLLGSDIAASSITFGMQSVGYAVIRRAGTIDF